jgi:oxygen-dependent protoporphyrinogen oxidase
VSGSAFERAITDDPTRVVVVGGGAAGLVAAREIARPGFEVTVLEARRQLGGSVARHELAGIVLDAGAESFATRGGHVAALIEDLGLADDVVTPLAAGAWLQLPDRAVPTPKAGILGIPSVRGHRLARGPARLLRPPHAGAQDRRGTQPGPARAPSHGPGSAR